MSGEFLKIVKYFFRFCFKNYSQQNLFLNLHYIHFDENSS